MFRDEVEAHTLQFLRVVLLSKRQCCRHSVDRHGIAQPSLADAAETKKLKSICGRKQVLSQGDIQFRTLNIDRQVVGIGEVQENLENRRFDVLYDHFILLT